MKNCFLFLKNCHADLFKYDDKATVLVNKNEHLNFMDINSFNYSKKYIILIAIKVLQSMKFSAKSLYIYMLFAFMKSAYILSIKPFHNSQMLRTRFSILRTQIGSLKHFKKLLMHIISSWYIYQLPSKNKNQLNNQSIVCSCNIINDTSFQNIITHKCINSII